MQQIPEEVAAALQGGRCVLWAGAGFGTAVGRPSWAQILEGVARKLPPAARTEIDELLEQGRLRTVLSYLHRHLGDDPVERALRAGGDETIPASLDVWADLPLRAIFATTYADVLYRIYERRGRRLDVISHRDVHGLTLRDDREPFILRTPPTGRSMRADEVFFGLVEEVVRTRTLLFAGFDIDDPDLFQILDLLGRVGRGRRHLAFLPFVSAAEAEELAERYAIGVVHIDPDTSLAQVGTWLSEAMSRAVPAAPSLDADLANLDLARALRGLPVRADLALDAALALDVVEVEALLERIPGPFAGTDPGTVLRAGAVLYAHDRIEAARRAFTHVVQRGAGREYELSARIGLSLCACREGDFLAAVDGLSAVAEADRSMAIVPPRFEIQEIHGQDGTRLMFGCRDRGSGEVLDVDVGVVSRPVSAAKARAFYDQVHRMAEVAHPALKPVRGAFADGRLFGVLSEPRPGFVLEDVLDGEGPMPLARVAELLAPVAGALAAVHAAGLVHRGVTARQVVVTADGPVLRGFGPPPVIDHHRPSVRRAVWGYAAPEVLAGRTPSPAADVYGLAAVALRCLSGRPVPVGAIDVRSMLDDPPPRLVELLSDALSADPARRPSAAAFAALLTDVAARGGEAAERVLAVEDEPPAASAAPASVPAAASAPVAVTLPEDPDDLEGWAHVLERMPNHPEARAALDRIEAAARKAGRWDTVASVLGVRARCAQVQADRVRHLRALADVLEEKLGAPSDAFSTLQAVLEQVPVPAQVDLLEALARLAEIAGRYEDLAASYEAVAARVADPAVRCDLYRALGDLLADRLGSPERALAAYGHAAEADPAAAAVHRARAELARTLGRHEVRAAALLALADASEGADRVASLAEAAAVLADALGDTEGALAALYAAFSADPAALDAGAQERLLALAEAAGDDAVWAEVALATADGGDPAEAAERLRKAADLLEGPLDDPRGAVRALERVTALDPADVAAARRRVALLERLSESDRSARVDLADALVVLADRLPAGPARAEVLVRAADLLAAESGGADRARALREAVLDLVPPDDPWHGRALAALEAAFEAAGDDAARVDLWRRAASDGRRADRARIEFYEKMLEHARRSEDDALRVEALEGLSALAPDQPAWTDELLAHYIDAGAYDKAGPLVRRRVDAESDPQKKADLLVRGAKLRLEIGKVDGAIAALEEAVELDPKRAEAHRMLLSLYDETGQAAKAAEAAEAAAEATSHRSERAALRLEAARRHAATGAPPDRLRGLYEAALGDDPDQVDAAVALAEICMEMDDPRGAFEAAGRAVRLLEADGADPPRLRRVLSMAGRAALACDEPEAARAALAKARKLGAHEPEVMTLLGDLERDAGNLDEALSAYQSALLAGGDDLSAAEQAALYRAMADVQRRRGDEDKMRALLDRALEVDPHDEAALRAAVEAAKTPSAEVEARRRLAGHLRAKLDEADGEAAQTLRDELVRQLEAVATLEAEQLGLPEAAVRTLEQVLALVPDAVGPLHTMLDILTNAKRWDDAVAVLERLAASQDDPGVRAKYHYARAALLRDQLDDPARAAEAFAAVLEDDPKNAKAYAALRALYEAQGDDRGVARTLRAELKHRLDDLSPFERVAMLQALARIYEERLDDPVTALAAYEQAAALQPDDDEQAAATREHIIELSLALGGEHVEHAIAQIHALIERDPMAFDLYHRLVALYAETGAYARAISVCCTLVFLKQATPHEQELAARRQGTLPQARASLDAKALRTLVDPADKDPRISALSSIVWPMAAIREGRTHAHLGVRRDERVPVSRTAPEAVARFLAYACQVFEVAQPDLFLRPKDPGGLRVGALVELERNAVRAVYPTVVAGVDALKPAQDPVHAFRAGRAAARLRPDALLGTIAPDKNVARAAVVASLRFVQPGIEVPADLGAQVTAFEEAIGRYLPPSRKDAFESVVRRILDAGRVDAKAYLRGVSLAASRAGLLLCDSLETAGRVVTQEADDTLVPVKDRIRDLVRYSVSRPYFEARERLFGS